jgi:hypothetical protein
MKMEREPMSEKKGQPYGDSPAKGIGACGLNIKDFNGSNAGPMKEDYYHQPDGDAPIRNTDGIGEGKGGMSVSDKERYGAI